MPRNLSAWIDLCIHLVVIGVLVLVLMSYNLYVGAISLVIWISMVFFARERCRDRQERFERYCRDVVSNINQISNYAIENLPQAVLIVDSDGRLQWANEALESYLGQKPEQGMPIKSFWPGVILEPIWGMEGEYVFAQGEKYYRAEYRPVVTESADSSLMVFYVSDITDFEHLRRDHLLSRVVWGYFRGDNYGGGLGGFTGGGGTGFFCTYA